MTMLNKVEKNTYKAAVSLYKAVKAGRWSREWTDEELADFCVTHAASFLEEFPHGGLENTLPVVAAVYDYFDLDTSQIV